MDREEVEFYGGISSCDYSEDCRFVEKAYKQGKADAIIVVKPTRANSWQPYKCTCGNAVMDDSNFCKKCGAKLDWSR